MSYCIVQGCRFPDFHTYESHMCGICHTYGHGQQEHGNQNLIAGLKNTNTFHIPDDKQCTAVGCRYKQYHMIECHKCTKCNIFGHGFLDHCKLCNMTGHDESTCQKYNYLIAENISSTYSFIRQIFKQLVDAFGNYDNPQYNTNYIGMGCYLFARRPRVDSKFEFLFVHNDDFSFDPECEMKITNFQSGYKEIPAVHCRH